MSPGAPARWLRRRAVSGVGRNLARHARRAVVRREFPVVPAHVARLDFPGAPVLIGVTSRSEILSRLRPCAKEPWTVRWLEEQLRPGDVLYDIGANVGSYALIAAALRDDALVVAFEPGHANYSALCDNIGLNGLDNITPLPVALAERTELRTLHCSDPSPGAAAHVLARTDSPGRESVLAFRLDNLRDQFALPGPTLMKLDVDGAEGDVLNGARQTLALPELRSLLIEIRRDGDEDVLRVLNRAGFSLIRRIDERQGARLRFVWYGIFGRKTTLMTLNAVQQRVLKSFAAKWACMGPKRRRPAQLESLHRYTSFLNLRGKSGLTSDLRGLHDSLLPQKTRKLNPTFTTGACRGRVRSVRDREPTQY